MGGCAGRCRHDSALQPMSRSSSLLITSYHPLCYLSPPPCVGFHPPKRLDGVMDEKANIYPNFALVVCQHLSAECPRLHVLHLVVCPCPLSIYMIWTRVFTQAKTNSLYCRVVCAK